MKIEKDWRNKGKHIIDFENDQIEVGSLHCACNELFNPKYISLVKGGFWKFDGAARFLDGKDSIPVGQIVKDKNDTKEKSK